jgi:hypothetical protein
MVDRFDHFKTPTRNDAQAELLAEHLLEDANFITGEAAPNDEDQSIIESVTRQSSLKRVAGFIGRVIGTVKERIMPPTVMVPIQIMRGHPIIRDDISDELLLDNSTARRASS